jgi:hypothetical protein
MLTLLQLSNQLASLDHQAIFPTTLSPSQSSALSEAEATQLATFIAGSAYSKIAPVIATAFPSDLPADYTIAGTETWVQAMPTDVLAVLIAEESQGLAVESSVLGLESTTVSVASKTVSVESTTSSGAVSKQTDAMAFAGVAAVGIWGAVLAL